MRDSRQVLDYIDWLIGNWLREPEGHADDSIALEHMFRIVDEIRDFILKDDEDFDLMESGYTKFLRDQDYQASDFCTRYYSRTPLKAPSRESFQPLCDFLRKYLESDVRKKRSGEGTAWKWEDTGHARFFDDQGNELSMDEWEIWAQRAGEEDLKTERERGDK